MIPKEEVMMSLLSLHEQTTIAVSDRRSMAIARDFGNYPFETVVRNYPGDSTDDDLAFLFTITRKERNPLIESTKKSKEPL